MSLPEDELQWRFDTAGGPGGQHANRAATRVEVRYDVAASRVFDASVRERVIRNVGSDVVVVTVDETRSQWRNRQIAVRRLEEIVDRAAQPDPPPRKKTKPSHAAKQRRLTEKKKRSQTKQMRKSPPSDD